MKLAMHAASAATLLLPATLLALLPAPASALPRITAKGKYLYNESGERFYIKGIAYQEEGNIVSDDNGGFPEPSDYTDPLSMGDACERDVPFLQRLGVNTIRVYSVNNALDHSRCMQLLEDAGIYTIIDLSLPLNGSIDRSAPSWTTNLLDLYLTTVDTFSTYNNILAYNVANEVVTNSTTTVASPYIKAAARDVKAYIKSKNYAGLVSYASTDGERWRDPLLEYLSCGSEEVSVDLIGLNDYRWCGSAGSYSSSYESTNQAFADIPVPAYFSEFGCIEQTPRTWEEVAALFSSPMTDNFSGGLAFSYFPQSQGYGMITLSSNNNTVTTSTDFDNLVDAYANATGPNDPSESSASESSYPACPTSATSDFVVASRELPPTPDQTVCDCLTTSAFPCVVATASRGIPSVLGSLLDYTCSLLGQAGVSCDPIGSDGAAGTYGRYSFCDPATKLSYTFSQYYVSEDLNSQACYFSDNATINRNAPTDQPGITSAEDQCFSGVTPTFTPTRAGSPTSTPTGSNGNNDGNNGALDASSSLAVLALCGLVTAVFAA